jgi:hypothetical protein
MNLEKIGSHIKQCVDRLSPGKRIALASVPLLLPAFSCEINLGNIIIGLGVITFIGTGLLFLGMISNTTKTAESITPPDPYKDLKTQIGFTIVSNDGSGEPALTEPPGGLPKDYDHTAWLTNHDSTAWLKNH